MTQHPPPSDRSRMRRSADLAHYDPATVRRIVDASHVCHVAFFDGRSTFCIPTACWRVDDHLLIHGSNGSRMVRVLAEGAEACVSITHLDGLVLARSAFNHSMNYRSVVIHGRFETAAAADKARLLDLFMEHLAPGRSDEARRGDRSELAATTLLRIPLAEAVAKIRTGGPQDSEADMALDVWAGVLPIGAVRGTPQPDGATAGELPSYVRAWHGAMA